MVRTGQLREGNRILAFLHIGLVKTPFGRIEIRCETQESSHHVRIVIDQVNQRNERRIGMHEPPFHFPQILPHRCLREFHHVSHFGTHRTQDNLCTDAHLLLHGRFDPLVLHDGYDLHQRGGQHHDTQAGPSSLLGRIHHLNTAGKVMICF